ncbi:hypothetical protein RHMOL_Rhmol05G0142600 [Rhododendron molle]|uniref:Uncharacterized protein n=1 Tax=Rhododendron molle TaxID=49168 RepID=A0ACC0NPX4_RHOML|nr:hypothetical protein RHMOL_Rhmol05G0142600 [Rhododendron molle]
MVDHSDIGGGGEVVDQIEDRGGPMAVEEADLTAAEPIEIEGAAAASGSEGIQGREQEGGDQENPRAAEGEPCARVGTGVVEPNSEPADLGMVAEGPPMVGGNSSGISGSGAVGEDTGPNGSPPRGSDKGKGVAVEEEQTKEAATVEIREEDIAFRPSVIPATSSCHVPITLDDIAEHAPDEIVAKLLEDHPIIGEYVLKAKEDRARAIEASEATERAERETERERARPGGLAAAVEAEEAQGPRVSAVTEVGAMTRPEFSEETYTLPRPHLFVPSGFAGYRPPQQTDYDIELVLRDPQVHIANTWAEVYLLITPFVLLT